MQGIRIDQNSFLPFVNLRIHDSTKYELIHAFSVSIFNELPDWTWNTTQGIDDMNVSETIENENQCEV